jgi:hypothetical protein
MFFYRSRRLISITLGRTHPWVNGIRMGHLKIFFSRTTGPEKIKKTA